jgi:hypothetical protein
MNHSEVWFYEQYKYLRKQAALVFWSQSSGVLCITKFWKIYLLSSPGGKGWKLSKSGGPPMKALYSVKLFSYTLSSVCARAQCVWLGGGNYIYINTIFIFIQTRACARNGLDLRISCQLYCDSVLPSVCGMPATIRSRIFYLPVYHLRI